MGCSPGGHRESDTTERLSTAQQCVSLNPKFLIYPPLPLSPWVLTGLFFVTVSLFLVCK